MSKVHAAMHRATAHTAMAGPTGITAAPVSYDASAMPTRDVTIKNNRLMLNGKAWTPRGLAMGGAVYPHLKPQGQLANHYKEYTAARAHFTQKEMNAIKSWGADSIRLQVSEPGLDPQSNQFSQRYVQQLEQEVTLARKNGLSVILCMQDQYNAAEGAQTPEPTDSTVRAWKTLAPIFAKDKGVMYELFNEPEKKNLQQWRAGEQRLVNVVRESAPNNVLIADGYSWGAKLANAPKLHDPSHPNHPQIAYGVHPRPATNNDTAKDHDDRFGDFAKNHAVIATEYSANPIEHRITGVNLKTAAAEEIKYMEQHHIGDYAFLFDKPGSLIQNWNYKPSNWNNWKPMDLKHGAGTQIRNSYRAWARQDPDRTKPAKH